ncbi:NAC domain-containing protein 30-like [Pistacia vera]|uniref:NAC domain-containing protein 30-like n=1 Tax=Pistacia vera TaxID=55513 RepID=UPI0012636A15|nr:NAC domain-containing protein 30-like [Pistacia vera]
MSGPGDTERRVENDWYFFTIKPNKDDDSVTLTSDGYYSTLMEEEIIKQEDEEVGFMKNMAYFQGKPPNGKKSKWTIYEFRVNLDTILVIQYDDTTKVKMIDST